MKKSVLDDEEKAILDSYESGEWVSVKDAKKEINKLQQCAKNTLSQNKRISIRMSSKDLDQVQLIAVQEGIPYQTLVSSIIHKYISGLLVERTKA
jgi:predicted DNA binding CopG/RHH family protein